MAPNVADRLSRLRITALAGTSRLPDMRNSTVKVTAQMARADRGRNPKSGSLEGGGGVGKDAVVGEAEGDGEEGCAEHEEKGDHGAPDHEGPAHAQRRHGVPDPGALRLAPREEQDEPVDLGAEGGQQRGEDD